MLCRIPLLLAAYPESGFTAASPVLPELVTEGDSLDEAFANARDSLAAVVELYMEENRTPPTRIGDPP